MHGSFPEDMIDHINGSKGDNRIENLRQATRSQNLANQKINSVNTSGLKGVSWRKDRNKWHTQIRVSGKLKHLGYYIDKHEAHVAYCKAADKYHGEFANYG